MTRAALRLDHDEFGLNQSKLIVIDSKMLARDAGGKPVATFPHPALGRDRTRAWRKPARRFSDHDRGFIIVAVLWILAALAAFVSIYAVYVINTAIASRVSDQRAKAQALITAALEMTAYQLSLAPENKQPRSGAFGFRLSGGAASIRFISEGARIDLNATKKDLLSGLFMSLGTSQEDAAFYAERVIGWRTKTKAGGRNEEVEDYQRAGLPYGPRQAPFQNVGELRLVRGLPQALVDRMLPYVTIFNGKAGIDVMVAPPDVLAALPDMSRGQIADIIEIRKRQDPRAVLDLLGPAREEVTVDGRNAFRVKVAAALDAGRRITAEIVILLLEDGPEPYRILSWTDDFDGLRTGQG
jgi:general secretion pathway protein K